MNTATGTQLDRKGILGFLAVAFGFTWLIDLVLFVTGQGITGPWSLPLIAVSMFGPALATFVVTHWISPIRNIRVATGLRLGAKGTRWGWYYLLATVGMLIITLAGLFLAAAVGVYHMDLTNYSAYRAALEAVPGAGAALAGTPLGVLVWAQILSLPIACIINAPVIFGEEYGWRGYLLPALLPLGQWPALILQGLIWGFWHAPLILMGYNYPGHPFLGVIMMMLATTVVGILIGWTRLATGSVWPAVLAHALINGGAQIPMLLSQAGTPVDTLHISMLGWSGMVVELVAIGILVLLRRLPVRQAPDLAEPAIPADAGVPNAHTATA
ncbi:MAG TPA: CPBP family intramembrane glutamic endopeptidase [Chloroflexia bacterium]